MRKVNSNGVKLVMQFEGCKLNAYADPASPLGQQLLKQPGQRAPNWQTFPGDPWTVGWGSTGVDNFNLDANGRPTSIGPKTVWTQEQADKRLSEDLDTFAKQVTPLLKVEVNDNQFAALVSFAYNVGVSNLKKSTLLTLVNQKNFTAAADEFPKWNKAQGKVLLGLTRRREAERRLFLTPV
jgi:lysozyme